MQTYGLAWCNVNQMSTYETILRIVNSYVKIWDYIAHYELIYRHLVL